MMIKNTRSVRRPLIALLLVMSLGALAGAAMWLENGEAVDPEASSCEWGGGREIPPPSDEMVLVPGGEYIIGDDSPDPAEDAPPRRVRVDAFYIDRHEVTNRAFALFVEATGYVTTAEREGGAWVYRGGERDWTYVKGADWRHPLGPGSSINKALYHPVAVVSWEDANAYAKWAGKRLPTEAEWEVAARGGASARFSADAAIRHTISAPSQRDHLHSGIATGVPHPSAGAHSAKVAEQSNPVRDGSANVWQGRWPQRNELIDGYFYTAPTGSFPPNALGIYDMIGNVWEWTADWYAPIINQAMDSLENNPSGPGAGEMRVARGGSWFCSENYCGAYRPGFRGKSPPANSFNNVGFRCARDAP